MEGIITALVWQTLHPLLVPNVEYMSKREAKKPNPGRGGRMDGVLATPHWQIWHH